MISRYDNVLSWFQLAAAVVAAQIFDSSTAQRTPNQATSGVIITNNDGANTLYLGFDATVSPTKYWKAIGPGASLPADDQRMGWGVARKLWVASAAGTPNFSVAVMS